MTIDPTRLQVSLEEQERWRRRLTVTVPAALVADEEQKAAVKLAGRMNLKGFRKGRVPKGVVQTRFGGALREEALNRLVNEAYRQALLSQDLRPISEGEMEDLSYEPQQDLRFTISFDVQPVIELARMGGFVVERPTPVVRDEHVAEILGNIQRQHGVWTPAEEGKAEEGNLVSVRIRRLDEEAASEGKEYEFPLGEGQAIPDVETGIRTLAPGETGEFTATFPDDFPDESRRGQQERVEITLLSRKVLELPVLDDALASQVGPFESVDALRSRIRQDLEKEAADQVESVVRGRILDQLVEANPFDVPRSLADRYTDGILGEQTELPKERLDEIRDSIRPEAERAVKRILVIERVAQTQNLEATETEIDARIEEIASRSGSTPEKVYAGLQKAGRLDALEREITEGKVFAFLKGQSTITDAPAA